MNFSTLIKQIDETHLTLQQNAVKAVNSHITLRNWLIGYYIIAFEQHGDDRAKYGTQLLKELAKSLNIKGLTAPELSRCRQFFNTYRLFIDFLNVIPAYNQVPKSIFGSLTQKSQNKIFGSPTYELQNSGIQEDEDYYKQIFTQISYTHFVELIKIKEPTKRKFYELSVIKNTLSVRELEHQIATLTYERVGLSADTNLAF
jgi:hypothetical protein